MYFSGYLGSEIKAANPVSSLSSGCQNGTLEQKIMVDCVQQTRRSDSRTVRSA